MKNLPIFRIISTIIAAGLLLFAFFSIRDGYSICHNFDNWLTAKPMNMEVDLSKKQIFKGSFNQVCSIAHGESVYLELPKGKYDKNLIHELKIHFKITSKDGKAIIDKTSEKNNSETI